VSKNLYSFVCFLTGHGFYSADVGHPREILTISQTEDVCRAVVEWGGDGVDMAKVVVLVFGGATVLHSAQSTRKNKLRAVSDWVDGLGYYSALFLLTDWKQVQRGSESMTRWANRIAERRIQAQSQCVKEKKQWIQSSLF
jgi:hypothetical protein